MLKTSCHAESYRKYNKQMTRKIAKHLASFQLKADLLISKSSISAFRYLMIRHNKSIYPRLFERKNKVLFVATVLLTNQSINQGFL